MKNRTILITATLDTEGPQAFGYLLRRAYYSLHWAESRKLQDGHEIFSSVSRLPACHQSQQKDLMPLPDIVDYLML